MSELCLCVFRCCVGASHAMAIRADMDALPIEEATGAAFVSMHPGKMHACGHDGHMAMALAAATNVDRTIREQPGALKRNVLFVFQPAEETTGGAKTVCESGVFERYGVDRIFGFHVWARPARRYAGELFWPTVGALERDAYPHPRSEHPYRQDLRRAGRGVARCGPGGSEVFGCRARADGRAGRR